tara:strand:- start:1817 stop:2344 length:528 start_codon:yes stop_codon:yes gene_type:complete
MKFKKFLLKVTDSTNNVAIKKIKQGNSKGIIIAEKQTKGRGQHGNKWISSKGNLFISIFFEINHNLSLDKLTKRNCLIIKNIITKFVSEKVKIKAPNDILIKNKKICGILQETIFHNEKRFIVIGIGINLFKSPNTTKYPTTHLSNYVKKVDKLLIIKNIKEQYEKKINHLKSNS